MNLLTDFDYQLPDELIARYPTAERSASRLLCLDKSSGNLAHRQFNDILALVEPGDLLVFNDTKVIPARIFAQKATGGKVEILVERVLDDRRVLAHVRASKSLKPGNEVCLDGDIIIRCLSRQDELFELEFVSKQNVLEILANKGHIPLPQYMDRTDESLDIERYQTVYAKYPGAVAAPTAGLHFDEKIISALQNAGINSAFVTLHVGAGTFKPVRAMNIKEHVMHAEYIHVTPEVCQQVIDTKKQNKRVIAVGTTSVRCLETAALDGEIKPYSGDTRIFIYPEYQFKCVDALITNFHLPQSTLLMLVCAFAGYKQTFAAYEAAIKENYRFYSYGDAMFIS